MPVHEWTKVAQQESSRNDPKAPLTFAYAEPAPLKGFELARDRIDEHELDEPIDVFWGIASVSDAEDRGRNDCNYLLGSPLLQECLLLQEREGP